MLELEKISKIIIANWKLHGSIEFAKEYLEKLTFVRSDNEKSLVVCAPSTLIQNLKTDKFYLGAQDCSNYSTGAYTGEISSELLREIGCSFCIVGHSERRSIFKEDHKLILEKIEKLTKSKIIPIFCIGENLQQMKENLTNDVLKDQIQKSLPKNLDLSKIIIAYEPVWSIGTGLIPSVEQIDQTHNFIKKKFFNNSKIKVVYGGSVKASNYKKIIDLDSVDGLLVGGASINLDEFNKIVKF